MYKLQYVSGTGSEILELDGADVFVGAAEDLRSRMWSYQLGYRGATSFSRPARTCKLNLTVLDKNDLDHMRHVFERDVLKHTYGTLVAYGEWETRVFVVAQTPKKIAGRHVRCELEVVLADGIWRKAEKQSFYIASYGSSSFLDVNYDLEYDLTKPTQSQEIKLSDWSSTPVKLGIYGYAANPYIMIGKNRYQVNITVPAGGRLEIDGIKKTVVLIHENGDVVNVLDKAKRGAGAGSQSYIFERVAEGAQQISWDNSFNFDLISYIEEAEPPWSLY